MTPNEFIQILEDAELVPEESLNEDGAVKEVHVYLRRLHGADDVCLVFSPDGRLIEVA
jgi:hypothetical protein